jgi:hypothetical protein
VGGKENQACEGAHSFAAVFPAATHRVSRYPDYRLRALGAVEADACEEGGKRRGDVLFRLATARR